MDVKLLAHTQLTQEFFDIAGEGFHDENSNQLASDGQVIALTAIRTCYSHNKPSEIVEIEGEKYFGSVASDGKGGNDADRLIRHIVNSGHCYDDKTEVLTNRGFVLFKELEDEDLVAQVEEDGTFGGFTKDWVYVMHPKEKTEGYIYEFENQAISFGVTSRHRMFISPGRYLKKWEIKEMKDIDYNEYRMAAAPKPRAITKETEYSLDELKLIGFFIGDGSQEKNSKLIRFHLKKERKIKYLTELLTKLGTEYTISDSYEGRKRINVKGYNYKRFYTESREKTLLGLEFLEGEEFEALFDGLMNSDGSYTKGNGTYHYCTFSESLKKELEVLFTINGYATSFDNAANRILLKRERSTSPFVKDSRYQDGGPKKVPYDGATYCVQVPKGILVVRRNGKTLVCGNTSTLEHLSYTFAIEGVSRSLLAQITRHRHLSFSVQSQRYNKLESGSKSGGFDYVVPESIENCTKSSVVFEDSATEIYKNIMNHIQDAYDDLRQLGIKAEDARFVLPNAATCNLVLTGNLRSFLEFCGKRLTKQAQWEIRELAELIKQEIIKAEPWTESFFDNE